jgi:hypothetical protein
MLALTPNVEKAISKDLPDKIGLIFDGWISVTVHFEAIFVSYKLDGMDKESLLAVAPLVNDEQLEAKHYIKFMHATLHLYRKDLDNIVDLIGDNFITNKKISNNTGNSLVVLAMDSI